MEQLLYLISSIIRNFSEYQTSAGKDGICAAATTFARMFGSLAKAYQKAGFE